MRNGTAGEAWKTILVILLLIISILAALIVAQVTLLWDWLNPLTRRMASWPVFQPHAEIYRLGRDRWGDAEAQDQALTMRELDVEGRLARLQEEQLQLKAAQAELDAEQARLSEWENALEKRELDLENKEGAIASLESLREVYAAMRPQEAAGILNDMVPEEIAMLLGDMPARQAGSILAALPRDKAAAVSRLMGL